MKQNLSLLSILLLTACAGSGASNPADDDPFRAVVASNSKITNMYTYIGVGQDNNKTIISRATTRDIGKNIPRNSDVSEVYLLDNVLFESADKEFDGPDEDYRMSFIIDDKTGEISGIESIDDGEKQISTRQGTENKFVLVSDEEDVVASVKLFGKQKGMKYSDFGFVDVNGKEQDQSGQDFDTHFIMPIAGGYKIKNITEKSDDFANKITFNGIAVANVGEPDTTVPGGRLLLRDDNATLTFDKTNEKKEVLTADFAAHNDYDDWYKVEVVKYADGDASISFTTPNERDIKSGFETSGSGKVKNKDATTKLSVDFDYYGDAGDTPSEATGIIYYRPDESTQPLLMGFGGKAVKDNN